MLGLAGPTNELNGLPMTIRTPGDVIQHDALKHLKIDQAAFADAMGMSRASISRILSGKAAITPESALRLEVVLNEPAEYWLGLQASYDMAKLRQAATVDTSALKCLEDIPGATLAMDMLRDMFHKYRAKTAKIPLEEIREVCRICDVDNMYRLMRRVDPGREVFDFPYSPGERGMHGLMQLDDAYEQCSDYFGEFFFSDDRPFPPDFVRAVRDKYSDRINESVFRSGYLAWNKQEGTHGYLVTVHVGNMSIPVEKDLLALSKRFDNMACYTSEGLNNGPERLSITAVVRTVKDLDRVPAIHKALKETAEKWHATSVKKLKRDRTFGDDGGVA